MTIAFIGLGIMGFPMARNLLEAGHTVVGANRSPQSVERFVAEGGRGAGSNGEAVQDADVIITMVPDSPDVEAVMTGEDGVFAHAKEGAIWIDTSTIRPDVAQRLAEQALEAGLRPLDAPVSGGEAGAVEGSLSIMVGGDAAVVEEARPVLEAMGTTVVHVGPSGSGQTVKAANQLIVAGTIQLVAESLVFLEAHGVDLEAAVEVLAGGLAGNRILDRKAAAMIKGEFEPGFRIDLHHKDLGIVIQAAREAGVVLPVGATMAQLMAAARQRGYGSLDHSALLKLARDLSGREQ